MPGVKRTARLVLSLLSLALVSSNATAETETDLHRWVPSFALSFDMHGQKGEAAITTNDVQGPPLGQGGCTITDLAGTHQNGTLCPESAFPVTPATASSDTGIAPLVSASLELATPRLLDTFFSPRLFAHVDIAAAFAFERNLAGERKPGVFFTNPLRPIEFDVFEQSVNGQGSRAKSQLRRWVAGGGAGVAFTAKLFERTVRVKPSLEYLRQEIDLIASVRRAVKQIDPALDLSAFRLIELTDSSVETLHGFGGGLELEGDTSQLGPFIVAVFINARVYRFTGNLRHTLTDTNEFGESATWRYELNPVAWRAGVGVRFRWAPEE